ncbi:MAG: 30S ribosomal protein S6 [Phycisphaerales bacterium]
MTTETAARTGVYECMFLAGQAAAAQFGDLITHINELIGRANGEVISMKKWDDRRLAYEMDKQKRGVYILAYINCPTDMVGHLERDVQISDKLLRVLVTSAAHLSAEEIAAADDRQALQDEAKMRAERAESGEDEGASKVRLGAPEQAAAAAPAEAAADEAPAAEAASEGDAPAEAPAE